MTCAFIGWICIQLLLLLLLVPLQHTTFAFVVQLPPLVQHSQQRDATTAFSMLCNTGAGSGGNAAAPSVGLAAEATADTDSNDVAATGNSFNSVPVSATTSVSPATIETANMAALSVSGSTTTTLTGSTNEKNSTTIVYGIRHGQSVSNVWMTGRNEWGAPTYNDTLNTPDAPLSPKGIAQATTLGEKLLLQQQQAATAAVEGNDWFSNVDLIVVSPLTRCLQTYQYAIHPLLQQRRRDKMIPVVVQPLLAERLYSVSETGRPLDVLQLEFAETCPELDWSLLQPQQRQRHGNGKDGLMPSNGSANGNDDSDSCWWYNPLIDTPFNRDDDNNGRSRPEWRPHGQGQYYGDIVGEPMSVFVKRMDALRRWLQEQQSEKRSILTVAHWGVYRHLANVELDNCQVCSFELPVLPVAPSSAKTQQQQQQQQQQEINASSIASPSVTLSAL